ncbi:unnamed protein product [Rotaria sp. Silwood1]|nr:unnamed protein product [Rotaria sp. Silwood1]
MTSPFGNISPLIINDNTQVLPNIVSSSTVINPLLTSSDSSSILLESLPPCLAAPVGWQSEIIHGQTSISPYNEIDTNNILINNTTQDYYTTNTIINNPEQDYCTTNTSNILLNNTNDILLNNYQEVYDTNNITTIPTNITSHQNEYINLSSVNNAINQQQTILTEQQNIINNNVKLNDQPPIIIRKKITNPVTYKQNVTIRYLKPPTPPPPGPLIIREVRPPPPPPQSPIQIRQRPPPCPTPPPIILRERPPPIPPRIPATVVEKVIPTPRPRRRIVVERYPPCPPKPSDVIIERWLPYKQTNQRPILVERAPPPCIPLQEPNLLVLHDAPQARICKEFINEGVIRADPRSYLQRYGAEINISNTSPLHSYLVNEASRVVPPPPLPVTSISSRYRDDSYDPYCDGYRRAPSPPILRTWERTRREPSLTRSSSYLCDYSDYDSPYRYCTQSSRKYEYDPCRYYDDYCEGRRSYTTMRDVTSSWNRYCNSSPYDPCLSSYYPSSPSYYRSSSCYTPRTIRVCSDDELRDVLCDLTNGHVPPELRTY